MVRVYWKSKSRKEKRKCSDAHEGIRPAGALRTPESSKEYLKPEKS